MVDRNKQVAKTLIAATAGAGIIFILSRYRKDLSRKVLNVFSRNPLKTQKIEIVNTYDECTRLAKKLKQDCNNYPVLGFDCEWVTIQGSRRPVALLQLSTHTGLCGLIRLCKLQRMPPELRTILEDEDIVKVGVSPQDDAKYLSHDYAVGVASTLDLRYMAFEGQIKGEGLAKMSKSLLNIELDKDWRIRCSDWEADELTERQIKYAANDAFVAIELFKKIAELIVPKSMWTYKKDRVMEILEICNKFLDIRYKELTIGNTTVPLGGSPTRTRKNLGSGPQKEFKRFNGSIRQRPLYDNCYMEAPDGELLCTCDRSKAEWYVSKGLAKLLTDEPYTIRLTFEPAGRAVGEVGKYYTIPKENKCVVCGKEDTFIRKNVVPREYRKYFPVVMKNHTSHDILLLCTVCHQLSNMSDLNLRYKLADLCDAPIQSQENVRLIEEPQLKKLKSAARALYRNGDQIPEPRRKELESQFLEHFPPGTTITSELLAEYFDIDIYKENENFLRHGEKVVKYFIEGNGGGIIQLEKMWREHFLNSMKPRFLPELWSVDHNEHRLEIRADEGRVEIQDLAAAGIDPQRLMDNVSVSTASESLTIESDDLTIQELDETQFLSIAKASSMSSNYETARGDDDTTISSGSFKSMDETLRSFDFGANDNETEYLSDDSDSTLTQPSSSLDSDTEIPIDDSK